jgi:hypothetical protein
MVANAFLVVRARMQMKRPCQVASCVNLGGGKKRQAVSSAALALLGGIVVQQIKDVRSASEVSSLAMRGAKIALAAQRVSGPKKRLRANARSVLPI